MGVASNTARTTVNCVTSVLFHKVSQRSVLARSEKKYNILSVFGICGKAEVWESVFGCDAKATLRTDCLVPINTCRLSDEARQKCVLVSGGKKDRERHRARDSIELSLACLEIQRPYTAELNNAP